MISRMEKLCIDRGLKMTEQRRVIARVLSESADHPDVEQVYRRAAAIDPHISIATVGNPAMRVPDAKGFSLPTILGMIPGMSAFATAMMNKEMAKLDIPPVPEFIEMIHDAGGHIFACKATVDMFHLTNDDFCPQVGKVLTVGEFYELSAGAQIIFT